MEGDQYMTAAEEMEPWYWWGIPTFFKCRWDHNADNCDIALVGVPHSSGNGSTERDQHLAPRAVRDVSGRFRRAHQLYGFRPWDEFRIHDLGDVPLPHAMVNDACLRDIEGYFRVLDRARARPVAVGGDHSITGPILKALGGQQSILSGGNKLSLVHFDAHRDDYSHLPHWLGNERSAAHWAAYTIREGHVDAERSIQLGLRGNPLKPSGQASRSDHGYQLVSAEQIFEQGLDKTIAEIRRRVAGGPVYVTFDLDVLDPADAPGVSNLEAGYAGLRAWQAIKLLQGMRGLNVVGADIVCMMPPRDNPSQITALTASVLMFELLSLIAVFLRECG